MQQFGSLDYAIAGAGGAGCLLANRPLRDLESRALRLEAGGRDDGFRINLPAGDAYATRQCAHRRVLPDRARPCLAGRSIACARGPRTAMARAARSGEDPRVRRDILDARRAAAAERAIAPVKTFSAGDNLGRAYFQSEPAPRPAPQRENLSVLPGALVSKVRIEPSASSFPGKGSRSMPKPRAPGRS